MKALVLAAGKGSRLTSVSGDVPKPLCPVGDTTPLEHTLGWAAGQRPTRIWINLHQGADVIRSRIGDTVCGVPISYSYEPALLGTAGAWKRLESEWDATSLVLYGDNFMQFDLAALLAAHATAGALATIAVFDPARHRNTGGAGGRVRLRGSRVTGFIEGGHDGLINAGAYCLEPALAARLPRGFLDFGHDVLPVLAATGELSAHVLEAGAYCLGIDTPERLTVARQMLQLEEVTP